MSDLATLQRVVSVADRLKTPLSVAGVVVAVLYLIYRQILALDVFESIGQESTFLLLQTIIDRLFVLALAALILGVLSYLVVGLSRLRTKADHKTQSSVELTYAALDPKDSTYIERVENGKKVISPKRVEPTEEA